MSAIIHLERGMRNELSRSLSEGVKRSVMGTPRGVDMCGERREDGVGKSALACLLILASAAELIYINRSLKAPAAITLLFPEQCN